MTVYQTAIQRSVNRAVVTRFVQIDNAVLPSNETGQIFREGITTHDEQSC